MQGQVGGLTGKGPWYSTVMLVVDTCLQACQLLDSAPYLQVVVVLLRGGIKRPLASGGVSGRSCVPSDCDAGLSLCFCTVHLLVVKFGEGGGAVVASQVEPATAFVGGPLSMAFDTLHIHNTHVCCHPLLDMTVCSKLSSVRTQHAAAPAAESAYFIGRVRVPVTSWSIFGPLKGSKKKCAGLGRLSEPRYPQRTTRRQQGKARQRACSVFRTATHTSRWFVLARVTGCVCVASACPLEVAVVKDC